MTKEEIIKLALESGVLCKHAEKREETLRQYAAIQLRVPDSGDEWLDEMICKSLRDSFAAEAMKAYLTHEVGANAPDDIAACWAYATADAMLKAR